MLVALDLRDERDRCEDGAGQEHVGLDGGVGQAVVRTAEFDGPVDEQDQEDAGPPGKQHHDRHEQPSRFCGRRWVVLGMGALWRALGSDVRC